MKAFCGLLLQTSGQDNLSAQRMRDAEEGLGFYFFIASVHDNNVIQLNSLESHLAEDAVYCFKAALIQFVQWALSVSTFQAFCESNFWK